MPRVRAPHIGPWSTMDVRQLLRQFGPMSRNLPSVMATFRWTTRKPIASSTGSIWAAMSGGSGLAGRPAMVPDGAGGRPRSSRQWAAPVPGTRGPPVGGPPAGGRDQSETPLPLPGRGGGRVGVPDGRLLLDVLDLVIRIAPKPPAPGTPIGVPPPIAACRTGGSKSCSRATSGPAGGSATWSCISGPGSGHSPSTRSAIRSCGGWGEARLRGEYGDTNCGRRQQQHRLRPRRFRALTRSSHANGSGKLGPAPSEYLVR